MIYIIGLCGVIYDGVVGSSLITALRFIDWSC